MTNRFKTLLLLATLTALMLAAGRLLGGTAGLWIALVFAALMNLGTYWFADRIVLRMHHAREANPLESPGLYGMVQELASRAGIPTPKLYIIPESAPNALATGRNPEHAVVAVTEGLLATLDRREVAAVIAHELGHIRHRDTLIMAVAATLAGALSALADMAIWSALLGGGRHDEEDGAGPMGGLLGVLIAPIAATLIQMSISRSREYLADEAAARFTGDPLALAGALRKIEAWSHEVPMQAASPATAHLYIHNPFHAGAIVSLFRTHPPTEKRVARLEAMAMGRLPYAA